MNPTCGEVLDRLPDWSAGRLAEAEAGALTEHLAGCASCAAEAEVVGSLVATRPAPPLDLAARIAAAARSDVEREHAIARVSAKGSARARVPAWALSAAAVLALAFGTTWIDRPQETLPAVSPTAAALGEVPVENGLAVENAVLISDDGVVAGAPVLDELSDDNLVALLEEMGG